MVYTDNSTAGSISEGGMVDGTAAQVVGLLVCQVIPEITYYYVIVLIGVFMYKDVTTKIQSYNYGR